MPESQNTKQVSAIPGTREEKSQELNILLQKVLGSDNAPEFTKEQVDEVLSQKREITSFIHEDKKRESFDNRLFLITILVFILLFSGLVLWKKPDMFNEVLSFLAGIFGGGLGGYGLAIKKRG